MVFALLLIKQGRLGEGAQQVAALGEQLLRHTLTFPISEGGFPHLLASKTKPCRRVSVKGTAGDINHALLREPSAFFQAAEDSTSDVPLAEYFRRLCAWYLTLRSPELHGGLDCPLNLPSHRLVHVKCEHVARC